MFNLFKINSFDDKELTYKRLFKIIEKIDNENKELSRDIDGWMEINGYLQIKLEETEKENLELKNENDILKETNVNIALNNTILEEKIEKLTDQLEIKERLDTDKPLEEDYYNTKDLDKKMVADALEKTSSERDTYKEVIKTIIDKYNISDDEVLNIIDDIQINKSKQMEITI